MQQTTIHTTTTISAHIQPTCIVHTHVPTHLYVYMKRYANRPCVLKGPIIHTAHRSGWLMRRAMQSAYHAPVIGLVYSRFNNQSHACKTSIIINKWLQLHSSVVLSFCHFLRGPLHRTEIVGWPLSDKQLARSLKSNEKILVHSLISQPSLLLGGHIWHSLKDRWEIDEIVERSLSVRWEITSLGNHW